jgi:hypothetical protein
MPNPRAESIFRNEVNYKGEPIPKDAVPKGRPKPRKKFDWEKEKRRLKYPRQWPRGEGQP